MKRVYYATLSRDALDGPVGVSFEDFPGCFSSGDTIEEAIVNAHEALDGHTEILIEDGEEMPIPTQPDAMALDEEEGEFDTAPIVVSVPSTKKVRIGITLSENVVERLDKKVPGRKRSEFIQQAIVEKMASL